MQPLGGEAYYFDAVILDGTQPFVIIVEQGKTKTIYDYSQDFKNYRTIDSWAIDYESVKKIAEEKNKTFGGKIRGEVVLVNTLIVPKNTGEPINFNGSLQPLDPYWVFTSQKEISAGLFRGLDTYIDAINSGLIFSQKYYIETTTTANQQ